MSHASALSEIRTVVIAILALLCIGPIGTGLDLVFNFLPKEFPATQALQGASAVALWLWLGSVFPGVLAIVLHARRQAGRAFLATLLFASFFIPGANMVWLQFTFGCWFAIVVVILSAVGLRKHET
jgi:hypothetical protein